MTRTIRTSLATLLAVVSAVALERMIGADVEKVAPNTWAAAADFLDGHVRAGASATLLKPSTPTDSGYVLIAGGVDETGVTATALRYSPASASFPSFLPIS